MPITVRRLYDCDIRADIDVSVRKEISLVCFESFRGNVMRSAGVDTMEYTLKESLALESETRRLVARLRRPVTAEENDFFEEREGDRTEFVWT